MELRNETRATQGQQQIHCSWPGSGWQGPEEWTERYHLLAQEAHGGGLRGIGKWGDSGGDALPVAGAGACDSHTSIARASLGVTELQRPCLCLARPSQTED